MTGSDPFARLAERGLSLDGRTIYPKLAETIETLLAAFGDIRSDRRQVLSALADWVRQRRAAPAPVDLMFICTHNSRRSHIASLWAQAAAAAYGVSGVRAYSGGTEATAFNPRALAALERAGFRFEVTEAEDGEASAHNPCYRGTFGPAGPALALFSKVYDHPTNPRTEFAAIMTCAQAAEECPVVLGAAQHLSVSYEDPKAFDGTGREAQAYGERVAEIGRDLLYAFSLV